MLVGTARLSEDVERNHNVTIRLVITVLLVYTLTGNAVEVGGHLTEDTTWSPENNPYLVTEDF